MKALEFENISFSYGGKPLLTDINGEVEEGEIFLIAGPNASGKTTLAKLCAGLLEPLSGRILARGRPLAEVVNRVEYVAANAGLISNRTVLENIVLRLRYQQEPQRLDLKGRIEEICQRFGLEPYSEDLPAQLSSGTRRRVAIARALLSEPRLLIIDGLVQDLDALEELHILDLLRTLSQEKGLTVLLFSAQLEPELRIARRVGILRQGRLQEVCRPSELGSDPWIHEIYRMRQII